MTATLSPTERSEAVRFGVHDEDTIAEMEEHADDELLCVVIESGRQCTDPATHALVCMQCNRQAAWACDVHAVKVRCSYQPVTHAPCGNTGLLRFAVRVVPL